MDEQNKQLQVLENVEDKKMFQEIIKALETFNSGVSVIQVENFVLNDIEFPTKYGKYQQIKLELVSRYQTLVDTSYNMREKQIQLGMKEKEIENEKDVLKLKLLNLESEKLMFGISGLKGQLRRIVKETQIFYGMYLQYEEFYNLTSEKEFELEKEQWARKTLNMPTVFEERYGSEYMKKIIGEDDYKKYLEIRKKVFGLLPREMMEVKQLKQGVGS